MKIKPTEYLYNFYTKDDGDGSPIVIEIDGFKVQIGINVVILPGFHIIPCPEKAGQITIVGSNSFLGKGEFIKEGSVVPEGTILQGEPLFEPGTFSCKVRLVADDLGRKHETNQAILWCFKQGLIHHASIMVNTPFFDEAVKIVQDNDLVSCVGLHFNVLEGQALSSIGKNRNGYNMNWPGTFGRRINQRRSAFVLLPKDKKQLKDELRQQIQRFISRGFIPSFFDSHGNIHFKYPVAKALSPMLKENGFQSIRIPRFMKSKHRLYDVLFKSRVIRMYRKRFSTTDAFLSAKDLLNNNCRSYANQLIEIMVHPFFKGGVTINRRDVSFPVLLAYFKSAQIELVTIED